MKEKNKRIGIISYYNLSILDNGGKIRIYNLGKELQQISYEVFLIMPTTKNNERKKIFPFHVFEIEIRGKGHFAKINKMKKEGTNFFKENGIEIIIAEHSWTLPIGVAISKKLKKKLILDEHNIEYKRALELSKYPRFFYAWFLETILIRKCFAVCFVSTLDKEILNKKIPEGIMQAVIPNGTSLIPDDKKLLEYKKYNLYLKEKYWIEDKKKISIFVGDLSYFPNKEAVLILEQISKQLKSQVQFLVVGKKNSFRTEKNDSIIYTGFVDDIDPYLYGNDFAVIPIITGGGTNLKVIESLAVGLPVICTTKALEGIEINAKNKILNSDNFIEYPRIIINLCSELEILDRNEHLDNTRHWNRVISDLDLLLKKI